jgi:hypothetical protein
MTSESGKLSPEPLKDELIDDDFECPRLSDTQARLDVKFDCVLISDDEHDLGTRRLEALDEGDTQEEQELVASGIPVPPLLFRLVFIWKG